ncbi:Zeta-carotene desaturase, chloroplastic/chromoplastic [Vitis vinifera]|uniref:Zeta-carotene desaturase, chloroplastic/chromoplastic n=1 Tax=Vitis vinifera TaxID=29760 RepID=A0A438GPB5_VITVI|nr:Zeta-carotene desaturase, chloroplastic/chromoplastic [Vitis vinifera]
MQVQTYDKARNALALALSPVVRALVDPDGAMRDIRNLDSISFSDWFLSKGGTRMSIQRMWDPVAYALGFIDCDNISARCMLTIFSLFATKTEASLLRMLKGSPDVYLSGPIRQYITDKGGRFHLRWDAEKYFMIDLQMEKHMSLDLQCLGEGGIKVCGWNEGNGDKSGVTVLRDGALGIKFGLRDSWLLIMTVCKATQKTVWDWRSVDENQQVKDPLHVLVGPITKARSKKIKEAHNGLIQEIWADSNTGHSKLGPKEDEGATNKKIVRADAYVAACDVPGIKRLVPAQWRDWEFFDNIYKLVGVPVVTVQLRYNGWVTELQDLERSRQLRKAAGLDNLLYTPDADFSCFADLALSSPEDYYIEGQGSLLQILIHFSTSDMKLATIIDPASHEQECDENRCVLTPGDPYMPLPNAEIINRVAKQGPGKDPFRPDQKTPVKNFFLAGSYTKQDYIDSMEGATLSGRQTSAYICDAGEELAALQKKLGALDSQEFTNAANTTDELSLV